MPRGRPRKNPLSETLSEEKLTMLRNAENPNQTEIKDIVENSAMFAQHAEAGAVISEATLTIDKENKIVTVTDNKQPENIIIDEKLVKIIDEKIAKLKNCIPSLIRKRNKYGFLENVDYIFKEDGKVDWRKMIKPEFLVFNRDKKEEIEKVYGKKLEELSVTEVEDKYLLILLFGIRYLASLRGFLSVYPHVDYSSDYKSTVSTIIYWIGNNDTEMRGETFGDVASASFANTNGFGQKFLESIAANRSFVRAVRNYLEINIVGFDEVQSESKENGQKVEVATPDPTNINNILQKASEELGLTFEQFKEGVKLKYTSQIQSDYSKWSSYKDLPPSDAYKLVGILKERIKEKKVSK